MVINLLLLDLVVLSLHSKASKLDNYYIVNTINFVLKDPSNAGRVFITLLFLCVKSTFLYEQCRFCIDSNYLKHPKGEFKVLNYCQ